MKFFLENQKCDLGMIGHKDKYWKPSNVSTLEGFKLALVTFNNLDAFFLQKLRYLSISYTIEFCLLVTKNPSGAIRKEKKQTQNVFSGC